MRTILERYERLASVMERYKDQIQAHAKTQIEIKRRVLKELKLDQAYNHRDIFNYGYMQMSLDSPAVELWDYGRCGDGDSQITSFYVDDLIVKGDLEGYEKKLRAELDVEAESLRKAKEKENEKRREALKRDLARISDELGKIP